jgi:hypothetical protein
MKVLLLRKAAYEEFCSGGKPTFRTEHYFLTGLIPTNTLLDALRHLSAL